MDASAIMDRLEALPAPRAASIWAEWVASLDQVPSDPHELFGEFVVHLSQLRLSPFWVGAIVLPVSRAFPHAA